MTSEENAKKEMLSAVIGRTVTRTHIRTKLVDSIDIISEIYWMNCANLFFTIHLESKIIIIIV